RQCPTFPPPLYGAPTPPRSASMPRRGCPLSWLPPTSPGHPLLTKGDSSRCHPCLPVLETGQGSPRTEHLPVHSHLGCKPDPQHRRAHAHARMSHLPHFSPVPAPGSGAPHSSDPVLTRTPAARPPTARPSPSYTRPLLVRATSPSPHAGSHALALTAAT